MDDYNVCYCRWKTGVLSENIITYNALQKRKVYLDSIARGLDEFRVLDVIKHFPDLLSDLFVPSTAIVANDLIEMMKFPKMSTKELLVASLLEDCVKKLSQCGEFIHVTYTCTHV